MNTFRGINEFEKLYRASPVPKEVQDQWLLRKSSGTEGKFLLSSSRSKPVTRKITIPSQKARLLQRMQGRTVASADNCSHEENELINPTETIPKASLSALEFSSNATTLNLSDKLSVTLPEGNNNIPTKTTKKGLLTISSHEFSPVKISTNESKVETPVLKGKIAKILSNLAVSDTEDKTPAKISQKEGCNSPRKHALYFDGKSTCESAAAEDHDSPQESFLPGRGNMTSVIENTSSSCEDSDRVVDDTDTEVEVMPKASQPPNEPEIKKLSVPSEKNKTKTQAGNVTWNGNASKPVLSERPTSQRSTGSIVKDGSKHVLSQWIIKPFDQCRGVCVEGHKSGDPEENFWHSSVIVKRIDNKTVLSGSGTVYKLLGDIEEHDALEAGFPRSLVKKFKDGFPHDWEKLIQNFCLRKEKRKTVEVQNATFAGIKAEKLRLSHRRRTCEPKLGSILEVPSPVLEELPRTRSGRMVKPLLAFWAGQRVRVHNKTGHVEITPVESPVLDRSQTQTRQSHENNLSKPATVNKTQKLKSDSKTNCVVTVKRNIATARKTEEKTGCSLAALKRSCNIESVVVLTDINKENSQRPKKTCVQQTNKRAKPVHSLNVEVDVLSVIQKHKLKRLSQRKGMSTKTCYSKAGEKFSDSSDIDSDCGARIAVSEQVSSVSDTATKADLSPVGGKKGHGVRAKTTGKNREQGKTTQEQCDRTSSDVCHESIQVTGRQTQSRAVSLPETRDVQSNYHTRSSKRKQINKRCRASSAKDLSDSSLERSNTQERKKKPKRKTMMKKKAHPKEDHGSLNSSTESEDEPKKSTNKGNGKLAGAKASLPSAKSSSEEKLKDSESESEKPATAIRQTRSNRGKNKRTPSVRMAGSSDGLSDHTYEPSRAAHGSNLNNRTTERTLSKKGKAQSAANSNTWTKKETSALYGAVKKYSPDDPSFWMLVSAAVLSKTREECQQFYYRSAETDKQAASKASKPKAKAAKPVTLTGGVGTLKRKRELRELLEQHNEGYEDDYFDSTPMRKQTCKAPIFDDDDDDDDIFGDKLPFDTPAASRTPFLRNVEPVSTRKTPHIGGETPSYSKSVNRKEMDRYIHRLKKRRRIAPELTNHKNKKESAANNVEYNDELFSKEQEIEPDSEEESDYYWSDDLE
ncbi:mis18-binding protein 1-like [Liolophura sinensis]|uniref:mis18-binding protein 1-like n=1 Tax=Liolophura sinensis TaxID=3198878 RepID=UPI003158C8E7